MTKELDCKGLACPAPVLQTKDTIEKEHPDIIKVTVDNEASKQNVSRFLESQNFTVIVEQDGTDFHVIGKMEGETTNMLDIVTAMQLADKVINI